MENQNGTPSTMQDMILVALSSAFTAKLKEAPETIRVHMRDYLSQKFGAAMLKATPEQLKAIQELWIAITGEELK